MHFIRKKILVSSVLPIIAVFFASALHAIDFASPKEAKSSVEKYSSYSWDVKAGGWGELADVKAVSETYDEQGRITKRELSYGKGTLIERTLYEYSKTGIRKTTYTGNDTVIRSSRITIDGAARTEIVSFPDNRLFAKIVSVIDESGRIETSEEYDASLTLVFMISFEYDGDGNCTTATYRNSDGSIAFESTFEYGKRDENGNWLERTEICSYADVGYRKKDIARREIQYE